MLKRFIISIDEVRTNQLYLYPLRAISVYCRGLRIRVAKKAGRSVKIILQRSDPSFRAKKCSRQSCLVCRTGGKGFWDTEGITYAITSVECSERMVKRIYHGETSKHVVTQRKQHLVNFARISSESVMLRHFLHVSQ